MDEIKKMAKDKLRDNIQYEFKGNVSNTELMKQYQDKNYYVFVNVSSSEGIPVSIMEATSFGIPCIATDAGGTKEIIRDGEAHTSPTHPLSAVWFLSMSSKEQLFFKITH